MEERFMAEPLKATTVTCIPRLRAAGGGARRPRRAAASAAGAAPVVSVLDRVRDAVLRLVMLSAAPTKGSMQQQQQMTAIRMAAPSTSRRVAAARMSPSSAAYADSYRSEAVDECIEFLKRSAAGVDAAAPAATVGANSPSPLHASAACAM